MWTQIGVPLAHCPQLREQVNGIRIVVSPEQSNQLGWAFVQTLSDTGFIHVQPYLHHGR